ncbi:hypothetical protein Gogos_002106 [Gossypium gossypioides]|uniref:Uncharacterized protein n=2 Tax=Gossypium gossypioides TaxID=34282 RepID=A0A7J9CQL9_GOSGO|nr:hypothetical protein [Gossypium gossypioides]
MSRLNVFLVPTYAFSIFLSPRGIMEDMQSKMSQMWWTSKEKRRVWSMLSWERVYHPKGMGAVEKPCYTWFSINAAAKALKDGFGWQVGNGKSVNIRRDNSGFDGLISDVLNPNFLTLHERKVTDLWSVDQHSGIKRGAILTIGGLDNRLLLKDYACCIDWIEDVMRMLDRKAATDFFTTVWNSWNNRNNHIFRDKEDEARAIWERAKTFSNEFRIHKLVNDPLVLATLIYRKWEKPPYRFVKVNFNVTITPNRTGYGMIFKDKDSFVIGGGGGFKEEALTVDWAQPMHLRIA